MSRGRLSGTPWQRMLLLVISLYPGVLVLWKMRDGIGVTTDSVTYAAAAASFADGHGFEGYDGYPLTIFPPGYPFLLGVLTRAGVSVVDAAVAINVVAVIVTVGLTYLLAKTLLRSPGQALAVAGVVSLASSTVATHVFLWSEAPFTVLCMGALVLTVRAGREVMGRGELACVAMLAAAATTVRFVGVALVPLVVWAAWHAPSGHRIRRVAWALPLSLLGVALVVIRNLSLGSGPFGERYPGSLTVEGALQSVLTLIGGYVAPPQSTSMGLVAGVVAAVVLAAAAWLGWLRRDRAVEAVALFVATYWLIVIYGQTAARLDVVTERLGAPAFPAMVALGAWGLREVLSGAVGQAARSGRVSEARARALTIATVLIVAVPVIGLSAYHGLRFAAQPFGAAETIQAPGQGSILSIATALPPDAGIASNEPARLWWLRQSADVLEIPPSSDEWPQARVARSIERLVERVQAGQVAFLVVSDEGVAIAPLSQLRAQGLDTRLVDEASDGRVYAITVRSDAS